MVAPDRELLRDVEQFLYRESWLLESGQYREWLELMTADARYYLPNWNDSADVGADAMIAYDDIEALQLHVARMYDARNPALQPPARVKYYVTNIMIVDHAAEVTVRSSVLLYIVRANVVRHHPISCEYRLRSMDGGWKIAFKKVYLLENDQALGPLPLI